MSERHSYSALQSFKACPLQYFLSRIVGLEPRDSASNAHHLEFGKAMHSGLEFIYEALKQGQFYGNEVLRRAQEIFAEAYPIQLDPLDKAKTQANGTIALAKYVQRWADEDSKWRVISCELLELGNLDSGLDAVRLDLVAENLEHGGIYGFDHKVTGKALGPWYWDQFNPSSQITHYIDSIEQKYGSCEGFYINAVSLRWRDEKKSNGANNVALFELNDPSMPWLAYSQYEQRFIKGNKSRDMMAAWGLTCQFERGLFQRTRAQIEQERESTRYWKHRIELCESEQAMLDVRGMQGVNAYGFNTGSCYSCVYRGGEQSGGICRPGYQWPLDREIISLSYRQVCRQIILVDCPMCGGNGIDPSSRALLARLASNDEAWRALDVYTLALAICSRCKGTRLVDGPRCVLDRNHASEHSDSLPVASREDEIEVLIND